MSQSHQTKCSLGDAQTKHKHKKKSKTIHDVKLLLVAYTVHTESSLLHIGYPYTSRELHQVKYSSQYILLDTDTCVTHTQTSKWLPQKLCQQYEFTLSVLSTLHCRFQGDQGALEFCSGMQASDWRRGKSSQRMNKEQKEEL